MNAHKQSENTVIQNKHLLFFKIQMCSYKSLLELLKWTDGRNLSGEETEMLNALISVLCGD